MLYHIYNPDPKWTPTQKFNYVIQFRNRHLGTKTINTYSYLNLEMSQDNMRFLQLNPEDINMFKVLQESTCKNGKRRRTAARTLNTLGYMSGTSAILNDSKRVKEMYDDLGFVKAFEEVRYKEKQSAEAAVKNREDEKKLTAAAREQKLKKRSESNTLCYGSLLSSLGVDRVSSDHVSSLTGKQIDTVAWVQYNQTVLKGRVSQKREKLLSIINEQNV